MDQIKQKVRMANEIRDTLIELQEQRLLETRNQSAKYCQQLSEMMSESGKFGKSLEHSWLNAAKTTSSRIDRLLNDMNYSIQQARQFTSRDEYTTPSLKSIFDELNQLQQEFDGVELNTKEYYISVNTEPITLDDIYLGPFEIKLDLEKLNSLHKDSPYCVIALDPNPAGTSEEVTHPHVSNEKLCEGDGYTAIRSALQQGRLTDFFTMVKGILNTYNPDSPYVALSDWAGISCYDCGYVMDNESCYFCYRCEHDYCSECSTYCRSCDESICMACVGKCEICEEPFCRGCVKECSQCGESVCDSCMEDGLCVNCNEEKEQNDEQKENKNSETITKEEPTRVEEEVGTEVLSDSVGEVIVLQRQN